MAIELNKRKRKHAESSNANTDSPSVPPKKMAKKVKKSPKEWLNNKKPKEVQQQQEMAEPQVDSGYEEKEQKFSTDFKMLNFRAKLRGSNFITGELVVIKHT